MLMDQKYTNDQSIPFLSNDELTALLKQLIDPKYQKNISDWLYYAKPDEKKGLYILSKVIKHRGEKIFKTQLTKSKEDKYDINKLTMDEAFRRYQSKKYQSSYQDFYGGAVDEKFQYNNIFQYKEFQHLNYAEFIKREYYNFIQNWIKIEKSEQYKEYVLDFLRSFLATIRSNRKFVTQYSEDYQDSKPWDKFNSQATIIERAQAPIHTTTIEEMQARLELEKQEILEKEKKSGVVFNDQIQNQEEMKKRKQELVNGSKNLLQGIYVGNVSSNYQDSYKGLPNKYPSVGKTDYSTSMIKGLIPDRYTMKQVQEQTEISDELKNNVRTMLFK